MPLAHKLLIATLQWRDDTVKHFYKSERPQFVFTLERGGPLLGMLNVPTRAVSDMNVGKNQLGV